jgi:hypothetical protein
VADGISLFRRKAPKPANYGARRPIVASANRLSLDDRRYNQELANQTYRMAWQEQAWEHFDRIGEIKYAYNLVASILSRLRIYPAVVIDPESPPVSLVDGVTIERPEAEDEEEDEGTAAPERPNNGLSPQRALEMQRVYEEAFRKTKIPSLMRNYALNMNVPGECYLMKHRGSWTIKSTTELKVEASGTLKLQRSIASLPTELDKDNTIIGRIWREHPRYSFEPDSAMRSMEEECQELLLLSRVIRSNSRARLNAGILFVPDEIVVAAQTATDDQEVQEDEEMAFEQSLYETLTGPVTNEDNPNTVVPLLLRGPGEVGALIQHISMERKTDEFLVARAEKVLDRILQGLEVPKDSVTGYSGLKFANSVHVDENMYKAHIEPLALALCDALTEIILIPELADLGWSEEELAKATIWYDPSEIVTRPDRATDAQALYDRKELSGSGLRSAFGFSEQEAPTEEELAVRLALGSVIPPDVVSVLLSKALPGILGKHLASSADGANELPDSLSNALDGTEVPGSPAPGDLGDSVPSSLESGGTPTPSDSSAPADQWQPSTADSSSAPA